MNANGAPMSPSQAVDAGPAVLHIRFSARRFILWAEAVGAPLHAHRPELAREIATSHMATAREIRIAMLEVEPDGV